MRDTVIYEGECPACGSVEPWCGAGRFCQACLYADGTDRVRPPIMRLRTKEPAMEKNASTPEPPPTPNDRPAVWGLVMRDMEDRDNFGRERYGVPLQPHNGRDALKDLYQELLDACVYTRQLLFESVVR